MGTGIVNYFKKHRIFILSLLASWTIAAACALNIDSHREKIWGADDIRPIPSRSEIVGLGEGNR